MGRGRDRDLNSTPFHQSSYALSVLYVGVHIGVYVDTYLRTKTSLEIPGMSKSGSLLPVSSKPWSSLERWRQLGLTGVRCGQARVAPCPGSRAGCFLCCQHLAKHMPRLTFSQTETVSIHSFQPPLFVCRDTTGQKAPVALLAGYRSGSGLFLPQLSSGAALTSFLPS